MYKEEEAFQLEEDAGQDRGVGETCIDRSARDLSRTHSPPCFRILFL